MARQVIQQFGVRRRVAARAEIARRTDQTLAEMTHPDSIHQYARGQRIVFARDSLREFKPAAPLREAPAIFAGENLQKLWRYTLAFIFRLAAQKDGAGFGIRNIFDGLRAWRRAAVGLGENQAFERAALAVFVLFVCRKAHAVVIAERKADGRICAAQNLP